MIFKKSSILYLICRKKTVLTYFINELTSLCYLYLSTHSNWRCNTQIYSIHDDRFRARHFSRFPIIYANFDNGGDIAGRSTGSKGIRLLVVWTNSLEAVTIPTLLMRGERLNYMLGGCGVASPAVDNDR